MSDKDAIEGEKLWNAAFYGNTETIQEILLTRKDLVNFENQGFTPLYIACFKGKLEVAEMLIKNGAVIDKATTTDGATPLLIACFKGHKEIVNILIQSGADVNKADKDGNTALHWAIKKGNKEIVENLVHCGAKITESEKGNLEKKFGKKGLAEIFAQVFISFSSHFFFSHKNKNKNKNTHRHQKQERKRKKKKKKRRKNEHMNLLNHFV